MNNSTNFFHTIVFCFTLLFLSACIQGKHTSVDQQTDRSISWFEGYRMAELLEHPIKINELSDIKRIMTKKWYSSVIVCSPVDLKNQIELSSCSMYFQEKAEGMRPIKKYEASAYMEIAMMCIATRAILKSKPAQKSFIGNILFDESLPMRLPAKMALVISESESTAFLSAEKNLTWNNINKISKVEVINRFHAIYSHLGGSQEIELVAQGDFNGDSVEDLIITSRDSVESGSYSAFRMFLVTKFFHGEKYIILKEYKY